MTDILIYGAGAIGSFLGYLLSQSAWKDGTDREVVENVALLGRAGHISAIKKQGLHVDLGEKREVFFSGTASPVWMNSRHRTIIPAW